MTASTYSWVGTTGDFSDPSNWQFLGGGGGAEGDAPGPDDDAIIGVGTAGGVAVTASALQVDDEVYLNAVMDATSVDVGQEIVSGFTVGGKLYVSGAPATLTASAITVDGGPGSEQASVTVDGAADGLYTAGPPAIVSTGALVVGETGFGSFSEGLGFANAPAPGNVTVNGPLVVGDQSGSDGSVGLQDVTSVLTLNGPVTLGNAGSGFLSAAGGTTLNANGETIAIGSDAASNGVLSIGGIIIDFTKEPLQTLYPGSTLTAGGIIVGDAGHGRLSIDEDVQATVPGTIVLGNQSTGYGELDLIGDSSTDSGPTQLSVDQLVIGNEGTGIVNVESGAILDAQTITVGVSGVASVLVDGTASRFDTGDLTVGDETPTASNDQGNPDGTDGDWTYTGDTGTLTVSDDAAISAGQTLALLALAQINAEGTTVTQGGIDVLSGGDIEIGGTNGVPANTIQVDRNALLTGHGAISSNITGSLPDSAGVAAGMPIYSLTLDNLGTIEANDGLLDIDASITGGSTALIGQNAAIEVGGTFGSDANPGGTIDFQDMTGGTLVLDDPADFQGDIVGLSDGTSSAAAAYTQPVDTARGVAIATGFSIEPQGSSLLIRNSSTLTNYGVAYAALGNADGTIALQVALGPGFKQITQTLPKLSLPDETPALIENEFFNVTQTPAGALLTYTNGNPIDLTVGGPAARQTYGVAGIGITVGIISDGFNTAQIASDQGIGALPANVRVITNGSGDEGRAMAQIVHDIAPRAAIDFATDGGSIDGDGIVAAIATLVSAGCKVIVDDDFSDIEPGVGSNVEIAIDAAVKKGVTFVTAAGNNRPLPIQGHALDPNAITVAAMNWLAMPATSSGVGGYQQTLTESDSSIGRSPNVAKPNITAPDGGPTTLPLNSGYDPFFGTSAAAPVVAGVAALMLQANRQLKPADISSMLQNSATPFGQPYDVGGAGVVNAYQAVGLAKAGAQAFYIDPPEATLHVASAYLSQPNGDADAGSLLQVSLTMSAGAAITGGTPTLILNDGGTAVYDPDASDPGNANLVFDYTVGSADAAPNLAITGFAPNGAIVQDTSGDVADFSGLFNVPTGVSINSPLQVIGAASSRQGEVQAGATVELTIALNNGLTIDTAGGAPTLTLDNAATATYDPAESNLSAGTLAFDYGVGTADAIPDLSIYAVNVPIGSTIQDSGGDNADFSSALNQSLSLQVEPAFVNLFTTSQADAIETGQTTQLTLTMTQPVIVNTASGSPTLTLNDGDIAAYDTAASDPSIGVLVFDDTVASGDQTPDLEIHQFNPNNATIQDVHGVSADLSAVLDYPTGLTVNSPVKVTSVASAQSGTAAIGQTITITLTMNESAGVTADEYGDLPYLSLNDGEIANYDTIASTPTVLVFDYTVQPGDFTPDLTVTGVNVNGASVQDVAGNNADFAAAVNSPTGVEVVACFAAGTPIGAPRGAVGVEYLREGDLVETMLGRNAQPIVWIGRRTIDCAHHPHPGNVWPVRIRAHTFGSGRPGSDLYLSPDHAVFMSGNLIPVKYLINGTSITQVPRDSVTYYHLELSRHDVVLAAGLPVESYLDTGDRGTFANAPGAVTLHPDFATRVREAEGCAPLVITGLALEAVCRKLRNARRTPPRLSPPARASPRHNPQSRYQRT